MTGGGEDISVKASYLQPISMSPQNYLHPSTQCLIVKIICWTFYQNIRKSFCPSFGLLNPILQVFSSEFHLKVISKTSYRICGLFTFFNQRLPLKDYGGEWTTPYFLEHPLSLSEKLGGSFKTLRRTKFFSSSLNIVSWEWLPCLEAKSLQCF